MALGLPLISEILTPSARLVCPHEVANGNRCICSVCASDGSASSGVTTSASFLFSDLCGFTETCERHSIENVERLLDRLREVTTRAILRHDGIVNQFLGDEVYAVFGVGDAQSGHEARAVAAAIDMHDVVRRTFTASMAGIEQPFLLHTGINSGRALIRAGSKADGAYRIIGPALNYAARLRSFAAPDEILIGPATSAAIAREARISPDPSSMPVSEQEALRGHAVLWPDDAPATTSHANPDKTAPRSIRPSRAAVRPLEAAAAG